MNEYILHDSIYIKLKKKKNPMVLEVKTMVTSGEEEVGNDEDQGTREAFRVLESLYFVFCLAGGNMTLSTFLSGGDMSLSTFLYFTKV